MLNFDKKMVEISHLQSLHWRGSSQDEDSIHNSFKREAVKAEEHLTIHFLYSNFRESAIYLVEENLQNLIFLKFGESSSCGRKAPTLDLSIGTITSFFNVCTLSNVHTTYMHG